MARPRHRLALLAAASLAAACAPLPPSPRPFSPPRAAAPPRPIAPAPPDAPGSDDGAPPTWVTACAPGSPEHRDGERTLARLDAIVERLEPADDPKPALAAIERALAGGCFRLSAGDEPTLEADSGYALKTWWQDRGGRWWMAHYLNLKAPRDGSGEPSSVVAPTVPKTLTRETRPKHPLSALLCGANDPKCGAETAGWRERAEYAFRAFGDAKRASWLDSDRQQPPPESIETCLAKANDGPPASRYEAWRACLRSANRTYTRLPLGAFKAPRRGWLLVRGRRGHYAFCDEIRAYDLATGAAYVAQSCSGLALRPDGSVDKGRTDAGRKREAQAGRVSTEALREAALLIALAPEAQHDVGEAWGFALPAGVEPQIPEGGAVGGLGFSFGTSSAQTSLAWSYVVDHASVVSGTLTWPNDLNDAAREHAVRLLRYAESTLQPGCPGAAPPRPDFGSAQSSVSALDAGRGAPRDVERSLAASLAGARAAACAAK